MSPNAAALMAVASALDNNKADVNYLKHTTSTTYTPEQRDAHNALRKKRKEERRRKRDQRRKQR